MSLLRRDAKRDENEFGIVAGLRLRGYHVTRLNDAGVPDLLVIKPGKQLPIYIAHSLDEALEKIKNHRLCLIEVKMPGKGLTYTQRKWISEVSKR